VVPKVLFGLQLAKPPIILLLDSDVGPPFEPIMSDEVRNCPKRAFSAHFCALRGNLGHQSSAESLRKGIS
jgi:hypothetical protein